MIEFQRETFTDGALENLQNLLESRQRVIQKALGVKDPRFELKGSKVIFPWFYSPLSADEIKAYSAFVTAITKMANEQNWVSARVKKVENEKYAFRSLLLRLGFIDDGHKQEQKSLLSKLTGNSASKNPGE